MKDLIRLLNDHGTKILGYVGIVAGVIAVSDKELVLRTLGPAASDWAVLILGVGAAIRGHQATRAEKRAAEPVTLQTKE